MVRGVPFERVVNTSAQIIVGKEVPLFLRRESNRGFTSPVGFEQGVHGSTARTVPLG